MTLKNQDAFNKKHFLMYSILPAAAIIIGLIVIFVMMDRNKSETTAIAPPVAETATQGEPVVNSQPEQVGAYAMAVGEYKGETPEIFNLLDKMGGFKMDESVSPADTVYVVYDPRCPYCKSLYEKLINTDLKGKGITIKWLPTVALGVEGENDPAVKRAAYGLIAKNTDEFASSMDGANPTDFEMTTDMMMRLDENLAFLHESSVQTFGADHDKSVPATFFLDKNTGSPQMMYGASDDQVFRTIFGD